MATKKKPKPIMLKIPPNKNKKNSSKGNSYDEFKKIFQNEKTLTDREIDKLIGSGK